MVKRTLATFILMTLASGSAGADDRPSLPLAVLRLDSAVKAQCLPRSIDPAGTFQRHALRWVSGGETAKKIVAGLLEEADRMHGAIFRPFTRFAVEMNENYDIAGRQVFDQRLNMGKIVVAEPSNVALIIHEMGHILGNTRVDHIVDNMRTGGSWYSFYNSQVPKPCHFTQYAKTGWNNRKRNEEFAEVVSAYFTRPQLLKNSGGSCVQAYNFLKAQAFPKQDPRCLPALATVPMPLPRPPEAPQATAAPEAVPAQPAVAVDEPAAPPLTEEAETSSPAPEIVCTQGEGANARNASLDQILFLAARGESVERVLGVEKKTSEYNGESNSFVLVRFPERGTEAWIAESFLRAKNHCELPAAAPSENE